MADVPLYWFTKMAAVTSCENALLVLVALKLMPRSHQSLNMLKSCLDKHGLKLVCL